MTRPTQEQEASMTGGISMAAPGAAAAGVRQIRLADIGAALRAGWADFLAAPTQIAFLCVLYPAIGLLAAALASGREVMHLLYPMAAGFALVGPIAGLGLYEISRRREQGLEASWRNVFDVLRAPALGAITVLAIGLLALFVAWLWAAHAIFAATIGTLTAELGLWTALTTTAEGARLILWGNLIGFGFAAAVLVLTAFSFPMLLDRQGGLAEAVGASVQAFRVNPLPMAAWGLTVAALLLLGSLPFFIGLAVVLPVLGHATWHLYRRVIA
jgi:uncharacterized membrane protein